MAPEAASYTHGHHPSVIASHSWRTAQNSLGYLLPHLTPTSRILDIGCGPGTITCDLGPLVPQGSVIGLDASESVIAQASSLAKERGVGNVSFQTGDANALAFEDGSFDVVCCHQVLQHVKDPVGVLQEMKRVCKAQGGIVAARESDYEGFMWVPRVKGLDEWRRMYLEVARGNGGEPCAGRELKRWVREAGIVGQGDEIRKEEGWEVRCSVSSWCYATEEERKWWGGTWAERSTGKDSALAKGARERGWSEQDLEGIKKAWGEWVGSADGWFAVPSGEVVCRRL